MFAGANPHAIGVSGGTTCAACTGVVGIVEQLAYIHNEVLLCAVLVPSHYIKSSLSRSLTWTISFCTDCCESHGKALQQPSIRCQTSVQDRCPNLWPGHYQLAWYGEVHDYTHTHTTITHTITHTCEPHQPIRS
jgi:hypothetical protein